MLELLDNTLLLTVAGSRAYGTSRPDSDVDLKGVAVPSARWLHGLRRPAEQVDDPGALARFTGLLTPEEAAAAAGTKVEGTVYALAKFMRLAAEANPNILDVLFCRDGEVRLQTSVGERLREVREGFLSARARYTYAGYAASQLKRIRLHWRWLHQGPGEEPTRATFGLPEHTLIPKDQLGAATAAVRAQVERWSLDLGELDDAAREGLLQEVSRSIAELGAALGLDEASARWLAAARWVGLDDDFISLMQRERAYRASRDEWIRYQRWRRQRNPARAALEAEHGYDTKHAMHLVRLLRMGREILETGRVNVWRGPGGPDDAAELRAIRDGAWTYGELIAWSEAQEAVLDDLARTTPLPPRPDTEALDALCAELIEQALCSAPPVLRSPPSSLPFDREAALGFVSRSLTPDQGRLVFCAVTGSHMYGFTSPDSDLDLKGVYLRPTERVLGLAPEAKPVDVLRFEGGVEYDLTLQEAGRALARLLKGDGNELERLLSPLQLVWSEEREELQELARRSLSRRFHAHYRGYLGGQQREARLRRTRKTVLYTYRVALTGIHLLRTGELVASLPELALRYGREHVLPWVDAKRAGEEQGDAELMDAQWSAVEAEWLELEALIDASRDRSPLPLEAPNRAQVDAWLVRARGRVR